MPDDDHSEPESSSPALLELVDIEAFGRRFERLLPGLAEDLVTVDKEGAIYSRFWDEASKSFLDYRVKLLPREIVQYVDAYVAMQEFNDALRGGASLDDAVASVTNTNVRDLVRSYPPTPLKGKPASVTIDLRGCFASFLPRELEALVCGNRPERYQRLPDLGDDRSRLAIVRSACSAFPVVARHLHSRGRGRPPIEVDNEYDVQDLLYAVLRPIFLDLRYEEWTPQIAGRAKRVDLVFPELRLVLEAKMIRDGRHGRTFVDELMVDFESYHSHPACGRVIAFVYDPDHHVSDPDKAASELSGLRVKQGHSFEVEVLIRS